MDSAKFWDNMAANYAKSKIGDEEAYAYGLERIRSYLRADDKVLEIGCGTGSTALELAKGVAELLATDISPNMVSIGQDKAREVGAENLRFAAGTVAEVAPEAAPYDAVVALNLLHLLPNLEADLEVVRASLKPGGMFISKTFFVPERGESLKSRFMRLIVPVLQKIGKAPFVRIFRAGDLEGLIENAGFEIVETGCIPADRRFIVARKR